jgi:3-oxoacyl-[acyl-carrier-protein] synthase-3
MILAGSYKKILVIAAEKLSLITDMKDRKTCVLLGDGSGAAIVGESLEDGILSAVLHADGSKVKMLYQPAGGSAMPATADSVKEGLHYLKMDGREVYKQAIEKMPVVLEEAMKKAGVKSDDIDFVIFHSRKIRMAGRKKYNKHPEVRQYFRRHHTHSACRGHRKRQDKKRRYRGIIGIWCGTHVGRGGNKKLIISGLVFSICRCCK